MTTRLFVPLAVAICATSPSFASGNSLLPDMCAREKEGTICILPFEAVYAHRSSVLDRTVSLDGVLVSGVFPEPPENMNKKLLFFPSSDRARMCNFATAIEVVPGQWAKEMEFFKDGSAYPVTLVGKLGVSQSGHWLALDLAIAPALNSGLPESAGTCLVPPPPVLEQPPS